MKNVQHLLFLVSGIAKLQRERSLFCPRLFRESAGGLADPAGLVWARWPTKRSPKGNRRLKRFTSSKSLGVKSIEDLREKLLNILHFGKEIRKTAARTPPIFEKDAAERAAAAGAAGAESQRHA